MFLKKYDTLVDEMNSLEDQIKESEKKFKEHENDSDKLLKAIYETRLVRLDKELKDIEKALGDLTGLNIATIRRYI